MSEHRVTMLGASWRRFEDPVRSRDPRVRAVVGALATLPAAEPRPEFRAELRTQLVAIAPRMVAESNEARAAVLDVVPEAAAKAAARKPGGAQHADTFLARLRGLRLGRPLAVVASIVTAFVLLLGGAVWMSRDALPGDTLYGLKRASERVELATAGSDTEKAEDHLRFAATRAREVQALLSRDTGGAGAQSTPLDPETAKLVASTLGSADSDVTAASVLLGKQAVRKGSTAPLNTMTKWAPGQLDRLHDIAAAMPNGDLLARTESSANLVAAALTRAQTLAPKVDCSCIGSAGVDTLGPVPCGTCPPAAGSGPDPSNPQQGTGGAKVSNGNSGTGGTGGNAPNSSIGSAHTSAIPNQPAASGGNSSKGNPGLPLPTVKLPTSSLPVGVSSCSIGATLGPIRIGVGVCSLGIKVSLHP